MPYLRSNDNDISIDVKININRNINDDEFFGLTETEG